MTRQKAVQRLFGIWVVVAFMLGVLLTVQSVAGKYGDDYPVALGWLLALVVPPLSILGVAAFSDPTAQWKSAAADRFKYRWAFWFTMATLLVALGSVFTEPFWSLSPFELFNRTGILISLLQGLALGAIGVVVFDGR